MLVDIGTFGLEYSDATAINDNGIVIGTATEYCYNPSPGEAEVAFKWANGRASFLLQNGTEVNSADCDGNLEFGSYAIGINNHSEILFNLEDDSGWHSALWENGDFVWIDSGCMGIECDPLIHDIYASDINDEGHIVGEATINNKRQPYLKANGQYHILKNLVLNPFEGDLQSTKDINNRGLIIGNSTLGSYLFETETGQIVTLGSFSAVSINDNDQILACDADRCRYLYEDGQLKDLYNLIQSEAIYSELCLKDINNSGQIVGRATIDGKRHAILLNPCNGDECPWVTIQTEDYDEGGQNIGYFDQTAGNAGGQYRTDDADIWRYGTDNYYTGANATGEWLNYSIDVPMSGRYRMDIRLATPNDGRRVRFEFDGVDATGSLVVPNTGGWTQWQTISADVMLDAGHQVMRLAIERGGLNIDQFAMVYVDERPRAAIPSITPQGGDFIGPTRVYLKTTSGGASIYYTTDGTIPTIDSEPYDRSFILTDDAIVQAVAAGADYIPSPVATSKFTITDSPDNPAPKIEPSGGNFPGPVQVELIGSSSIYYTTDGTTPTRASNLYTGKFTITPDATVKAFCVEPGYEDSPVTTAVFKADNSGQMPYMDNLHQISPGAYIHAEEYDIGGESLSYHDATEGNKGGVYRSDDVDIFYSNFSPNIGYYTGANASGEWLEYYVYVSSGTDELQMNLKVATPLSGRKIRFSLDGNDISGIIDVPNTGDWQVWDTVSVLANLTPGPHILRITFVVGGMNFDGMAFSVPGEQPQVGAPTITPTGGTHVDAVEVSMQTATDGASIYYTMNGDRPDENASLYTGPFQLNIQETLIRAIAVKSGYRDSIENKKCFLLVPGPTSVATPVIYPESTFSFSGSVDVSIQSNTEGTSIYYTTDGTTPTTVSTLYTGPFRLSEDCTVNAIAVSPGYNNSIIASTSFSVFAGRPKLVTPTITPDGGTFWGSVQVSIQTNTPGATIYYKMDGSLHTTNNTYQVYEAPFSLVDDVVVTAYAVKTGYEDSDLQQKRFRTGNDQRYDIIDRLKFDYGWERPHSINNNGVVIGALNLNPYDTREIDSTFKLENGHASLLLRGGAVIDLDQYFHNYGIGYIVFPEFLSTYPAGINDRNEIVMEYDWKYHPHKYMLFHDQGGEVFNMAVTGVDGINNDSEVLLAIEEDGRVFSAIGKNGTLIWIGSDCIDAGCDPVIQDVVVTGMNDMGQLVGTVTIDNEFEVFLLEDGHYHILADLIQDPFEGELESAMEINNRGQVIGRSNLGSYLLDTDSGNFTNLGSFHPEAINNNGQILGCLYGEEGRYNYCGYLYEDGQIKDLDRLFKSDSSGLTAADINDSGQIVGVMGETVVVLNPRQGDEDPSITIQAEDYDEGGQNIGYFDKTSGNKGGQYRDDDVDIWRHNADTYYTGANATGEWLNYSIDIPISGRYRMDIRLATPYDDRELRFEFNSADATGSQAVPNTGGWNQWQTMSVDVVLDAGPQVMRMVVERGGLNIDRIEMVLLQE
jgi:hypothetical protein